ncbi:anthranilate phosphoribosyltransferase, chloroplastic-like isoform X2 [Humulus lupulus]|uniref:anthranilate phosphoribosyltransferase, chloroplastic-like isoform X2 n=1 Tax=Humulus lupulus TaxID=3486 RepID=UPI002B40A76A|nr:anthranilate phosphoribosyltransferase, chloroplastic-like isoform X2 [Humulus lupulus]
MSLCTHQSLVGLSSLFGCNKLEHQNQSRSRLFATPLLFHGSRRRLTDGASSVGSALPTVLENPSPPKSSFNELIESLISRVDLLESEAEVSLNFLLNGADEALISAFIVLLRAKGETFEEDEQEEVQGLGISVLTERGATESPIVL